MKQSHIPAEGIIMREGERGGSLFIIVEGVIGLWKQIEEETDFPKTIEIGRRAAGDIVGERTLLTGEPGVVTAKAITDSILYEITKSDIAPFLEAKPEIAKQLSEILAERERKRV